MTGFQTTMYAQPAVGIEGDWASANPKFTMLSQGAPIFAGPNGVTAGRFAWLNGNIVQQPFGGGRIGFVHRDQPSLIYPVTAATAATPLNWLPQSSMLVYPGAEITLYDECDVWVKFAAGATPGQKVYANYADGTAIAAATGAAATLTASSYAVVATTNLSVTGSISGNTLTVTVLGAGNVYPGTILAGAGNSLSGTSSVAVITGTQVLAQVTPLLSGEATGGVGRYLLNYDYGVSSVLSGATPITGSIGILTITTTSGTTWNIGQTLGNAGTITASVITANATNGVSLTGAGGAGTYAVSPSTAGSAGTLTATTDYETKWYVATYAGTNELAKISQRG